MATEISHTPRVPSIPTPLAETPDLLSQTQRAALRALIEARLDGIRGRARHRHRNDLLHELPHALGVKRMKDIPTALYPSAVTWLNGEAGQRTPNATDSDAASQEGEAHE